MRSHRSGRDRVSRAAGLLVAAGALLACNGLRVDDHGREVDHIRVPHDRHKDAQVDCIACHDEVWDEKTLGESHLPAEAKCLECHQEAKDKGDCAMCHSNVKKAGPWPRRDVELRFDHKSHIERVKEDCTVCHKQLPAPYREPSMTPPMAVCLSCHDHQESFNAARCNQCHTDLSHYPLQPITAYSHGGNFVQRHSREARNATEQCAMCHEQTFCADCHAKTVGLRVETKHAENVMSDYIHRNDFLSRHSIEAKFSPTTCTRCHGTTFCESCHTVQNLTTEATNPRDPHPLGWSLPNSTDPAKFHGAAARRDITSCAACHDQGPRSNCIDCHKVGGIGGNPHPAAWTDRHAKDEINKNGMCLYCHQP